MNQRSFAPISTLLLSLVFVMQAAGNEWNFEIKPDPNNQGKAIVQLKGEGTILPLPEAAGAAVTVLCTDPVDCTRVKIFNGSSQLLPVNNGTVDARTLTGKVTANAVKSQDSIKVTVTQPDGEKSFTVGAPEGGKPAAAAASNVPLAELLQTACPVTIKVPKPYDRQQNTAKFVVNPLGNVIIGPHENIDENDTVQVTVIGDSRLLPFLRVRRKSPIRDVNTISIVGSDQKVPTTQLAQALACDTISVELRDFARGKGEVEIIAQVGEREIPVGSFEFAVDAIYDGMFSLGAINSALTDRTFALTTQGDKKIVYAQQEGKTTLYAVMYTPFVWGARDIKKPVQKQIEHLNPVFGFTLTDAGKHAIAGISLDYGGFVLSAGEHFARNTVLSKSSGLQEGSAFTGDAAAIPTAKKWERGHFVGFSIDLRAAVLLLKTITP